MDGLRLELSLALLPPDGQPPQPLGEPQVLLDRIVKGGFSYRGVDEQGEPAPWSTAWPDGRRMPQLVRIELQAEGDMAWPQLDVPLRADPLLVNLPGMRGR